MNLGPQGLALIKRFEGLRLSAYLCSAGVPTIGYGHTKGVKLGDTCTLAQAEAWLLEDCQEAVDAVNRLVTVPLSQEQFDALASFTFNLGAKSFRDSTLLRLLNAGNYDSAAGQFERWVKAAGVTVPGLVRRRESERELFLCSSTSPPLSE